MFIMNVPPEPPSEVPVLMVQAGNEKRWDVVMQDLTPEVAAQDTPIVLAQAAAPGAVATPQPDYILNTCKETESTGDPRSAMRAVNPAGWLAAYIENHSQRLIDSATEATIKTTLLEGTKHGNLVAGTSTAGRSAYRYDPTPDYIGNDRAVFLAEFEGKRYKIVVELHVFIGVDENNPTCPPPQLIKVNGKPVSGSSGYDLNISPVTFADLSGSALGQTNTNGITLDANAAGYNWFIDTTPADNSEYLPTSNSNEWVAKAGSAAYGKMDMLSVLLHEYGHALGIDHSADKHDYMATTLTPGVRRMPSAEELALMQQLVAQAKGEMIANASTPTPTLPLQGGGGQDAPFPTLPLGASFGLAFIGRLRGSRYGGMSIAPDYATLTTQYAVAANATFANLNTAGGWNTQGSVDFAPSTGSGRTDGGSVTLNEVSTSQTRLSQVFMLNEQDRYLSFTLSGAALDNLTGAPDDAFEVALLDANTGASLLGSDGLTRTDAFLNLQGDGTQHTSDCVTCINNADGSRTYRVDLTGVAKNMAVNLSFDLLGFGQSNSHVTLRDIRVSGLPQLRDEVASIAEDNLLTFNPFTQADSQLIPSLASHIVDAPVHGALAMNADGTFSYTPDLNYFGADSFSYRLSDGALDSNLATVSLTVTPVNDAPVVADVQATTSEDTELVIALGAYASDVDSTTMTTQIVAGPAHGVLVANADGTYSYTPDANYNGADSFTYKVNDGALDSNIATVTLAVTSVNDTPQGANATVTTLEDTPYVFQLSDFGYSDIRDAVAPAQAGAQSDQTLDSGLRRNDGSNNFAAVIIGNIPLAGSLTLNGVAVTSGQSISVADIAAGLLQFVPVANANGAPYDSFTFRVQDDGGTANGGVDIDQTARTMTIAVTAVNDAPVAVDTQATTNEDTPLNLNLLAAASDVDGDVLTPVIIAGPLHGQLVSNADGTFTYVPDLNYFGTDSFTYKISDGQLDSNIVTASLTIAAVNDAPVAVSASVTGKEDTPYIFSWNDFKVSDVDSVGLAITINTLPADGLLQYYDGIQWLAVAAGQRITRTDIDAGLLCFGPNANESGFAGYTTPGTGNLKSHYASFTYQADDGFLSSTVASMTVDITPVADAPSLALSAVTDTYGATATRFRTSWETASNLNPTFTILPQSTLEGWNVVRETGDTGQSAFVIWSAGDKMKDATNTNRIVAAAPGPSPTLHRKR